jgi:hypothetical protein
MTMSAQVKKGSIVTIDCLEDYLLQSVSFPDNYTLKPIKLNYYNFIECITELLNQFAKSKGNISFNLFLVDYYVRKY